MKPILTDNLNSRRPGRAEGKIINQRHQQHHQCIAMLSSLESQQALRWLNSVEETKANKVKLLAQDPRLGGRDPQTH